MKTTLDNQKKYAIDVFTKYFNMYEDKDVRVLEINGIKTVGSRKETYIKVIFFWEKKQIIVKS